MLTMLIRNVYKEYVQTFNLLRFKEAISSRIVVFLRVGSTRIR